MRRFGESESKFLKKEDLLRPGSRDTYLTANVTVESVGIEELGDEKEKKYILYFKGKDKGLALNKTMEEALMDLFGDPPGDGDDPEELAAWLEGSRVQLYVDPKVKFAGKRVGGLRLREAPGIPASAPATPPEEPPLPDDEHDGGGAAEEIPF